MFRGFRRGTKGGPKGGKEGLSRGNTGSKNVLQSGRNVIKLILMLRSIIFLLEATLLFYINQDMLLSGISHIS